MKRLKLKSLIALSVASLLTMATILPTSASAAWKQDSTGWWNTEGDSYSTGWRSIDNAWYYFNTDGYMKTGWVSDNGAWYYLNDSGSMKTGWLNNNGTWYYLDPSSGSMKTGLLQVDNKTYYLNNSGAMQTGTITVNGQSYTFNANGERVNSATSNTNTTAATTTTTATDSTDSTSSSSSSSSSSSGGSGGSGGSSSSSSSSSTSSYKNVFGTWGIAKELDSKGTSKLSAFQKMFAIGQTITISKDKIDSSIPGYSVTNPTFSSKTLTASAFADTYPDTFSSLGIDSNSIQCVNVSGSSSGTSGKVSLLVIDDNTIYIYVKGSLFELDKQ